MKKLPLRAEYEILKNNILDKGAGGFASILGFARTGVVGAYATRGKILSAYSGLPWLRAAFGKVAEGTSAAPWFIEAASVDGKFVEQRTWANANGPARKRIRNLLTKAHVIEEIFDHPVIDLLLNPNPFMQGPSLISLTTLHMELVGESIWYVEKENGIPKYLWPLPPSWITERPSKTTGENSSFTIDVEGFPKEIPMSECVWFRVPDPADPYSQTVGTAGALADELETDEYASQHVKAFFLNSARPDILITGTGLSPEESERAEEHWLGKLKGYWKAHRPHFIGAEARVTELTNKFTDMQLTELRKWQRDIVLQAVGLPPEILGVLESSNRATIDTAAFIFAKWVLTPRLELMRATMQSQLIPHFDPRLVIEYISPVEEDREYALKVREVAPWAWTLDDWRELVGDAPFENGEGDHIMVPASFVPTKSSEISQFVSPFTQQNGSEIEASVDKLKK